MAITKIFTVKERIDHLIDYIVNPDKTSDCKYVSGTNCSVDTAAEMMRASYTLNDKPLRVEGYHIIQSFAKGETDAKTAHSIGVAFAERLWGGRFQVVVTTHINTDVCHNHIALCSTSFVDGKRYHSCKDAYQLLRDTSDALCREYGLSIIEKPEDRKYKSFAEVKAEREGKPTWRSLIKEDVDEAIERATSTHGFLQNLRNIGYEIKMGSDVSVRPPGKERFVRLEHNLGSDYSIEAIKRQLLSKVSPTLPIPKPRAKDARPDKLPPVLKGSIVALYRHYLYLFG